MDANFDLQRVYVCRSYNSSNFPKKKFKNYELGIIIDKIKGRLVCISANHFVAFVRSVNNFVRKKYNE
jgi:hypothetical protein